ncbi:hypothetical protein PNOK_0099000 [Pyrrhoderma noxium]|uniref:Uncharacterized protein n=1 Tax=Pyrrhoderma noxium TaxID=2282107 RepID=A0A286UWM1_9AGAM|nr:hypothetical protein PNOK_0099000 [Pyrrhoderma noxium]
MIKSFLDKLKRKGPSQQNAQQSTTSSCSGNSGREDAEPEDEASYRHAESNFILKLTANVRRKRMSAYVERYSPVPDCDNLDSNQRPTSHRPERDNTTASQSPRTQSFGRRRALSLGDLDDLLFIHDLCREVLLECTCDDSDTSSQLSDGSESEEGDGVWQFTLGSNCHTNDQIREIDPELERHYDPRWTNYGRSWESVDNTEAITEAAMNIMNGIPLDRTLNLSSPSLITRFTRSFEFTIDVPSLCKCEIRREYYKNWLSRTSSVVSRSIRSFLGAPNLTSPMLERLHKTNGSLISLNRVEFKKNVVSTDELLKQSYFLSAFLATFEEAVCNGRGLRLFTQPSPLTYIPFTYLLTLPCPPRHAKAMRKKYLTHGLLYYSGVFGALWEASLFKDKALYLYDLFKHKSPTTQPFIFFTAISCGFFHAFLATITACFAYALYTQVYWAAGRRSSAILFPREKLLL